MQAKLVHFNELGKTLEDSQAFFFFWTSRPFAFTV